MAFSFGAPNAFGASHPLSGNAQSGPDLPDITTEVGYDIHVT